MHKKFENRYTCYLFSTEGQGYLDDVILLPALIVDVVGVLTEQGDFDGARNYWKVLKKRLKDEGSQLVTKCNQLKMKSPKD